MGDKSSREIRLAYKILDYVNGKVDGEGLSDIKDVKKIAKIIEEFDGRETVSLHHIHPHRGYLRLITKGME